VTNELVFDVGRHGGTGVEHYLRDLRGREDVVGVVGGGMDEAGAGSDGYGCGGHGEVGTWCVIWRSQEMIYASSWIK
jgi:hypothetical protein